MHVADDVEGPVLLLAVVPERLALDGDGVDLLGRGQHEHVAEALALQAAERPAELLPLLADHVRPEVAVCPSPVPLQTQPLREVEHDGNREAVVGAGQGHQRLARLHLHVGRIHDREPARGEPLAGDEMQGLEGVLRRRLVVLVVGDEPAAEIRRDDLRGLEVTAGEGRLARAGGADEHDERELGDDDALRRLPVSHG